MSRKPRTMTQKEGFWPGIVRGWKWWKKEATTWEYGRKFSYTFSAASYAMQCKLCNGHEEFTGKDGWRFERGPPPQSPTNLWFCPLMFFFWSQSFRLVNMKCNLTINADYHESCKWKKNKLQTTLFPFISAQISFWSLW